MSAIRWLAIGATALLLVGVGVYEERRRWQQRGQINRALDSLRCLHCDGRFAQWRGEMSGSHYTFIDDVAIPDVIDVTCSACGRHAGAFWSASGELTLDRD